MKTYYECIPCFVRQALDAARLASPDENIHEQVLRGVLKKISQMNFQQSPPEMSQYIHQLIRQLSGNSDPYKALKDQFNEFALNLYQELKKQIQASPNQMETGIRLAIAGNIIDFGANGSISRSEVMSTIEQSLSEPIFGEMEPLINAVQSAQSILYMGDNAGEIVFDRLLIELLPREKLTYVVRGAPVINDATFADAEAVGMTQLVKVCDNGSDAPGTILEKCSESFQTAFSKADLVIAKGQGNYETLSDRVSVLKRDKQMDIFFILKVKCPVIAAHIGCAPGRFVIQQQQVKP